MSKDEFLMIETCVLKVNIHCDGCKQKVKKTLQKIDGVYTIKIDSEQGKVTVSGNVDPATLIKKIIKNGKHAEIWGASKPHDNVQNKLNNQFKNLMIDNGKGENSKGDIKKGGDDKPKGGGQDPLMLLKQLQQMKGFLDLKPLPLNKDHNQKSGKPNFPEDEDLSDNDDEYYDDDDDDEFENDVEDAPLNKMKPMGGNGHDGSFMSNLLMNSQNLVKAGGNDGGNGSGNGKKGGGGESDGGSNGGKKGSNQSEGGGKSGGAQPKDSKNGGGGGSRNNKNDNHGGSGVTSGKIFMPNGDKKSGGMIDETRGMPNVMSMNLPIDPMGNIPTRPIGNIPAVQGLPALNASSGGGGEYFHGGRPEHMAGNPYHQQQQLAAMMMNQRRASGNENFQPMIYARPPGAVNYMPFYLPYPYPPSPGEQIDQYSMFSDENTSSCIIM